MLTSRTGGTVGDGYTMTSRQTMEAPPFHTTLEALSDAKTRRVEISELPSNTLAKRTH